MLLEMEGGVLGGQRLFEGKRTRRWAEREEA